MSKISIPNPFTFPKLRTALVACSSLACLAFSSCATTEFASVPARSTPAATTTPTSSSSSSTSTTAAEATPPALSIPGYVSTGRTESGEASWYNTRCNGGTTTASGEPLRNDAMTAAHKTLPMGTLVKVTNLRNGNHAVVRITDRGPFTKGRVIDVTEGVARRLDFVQRGVAPVKLTVVQRLEDATPQSTSDSLASSSPPSPATSSRPAPATPSEG